MTTLKCLAAAVATAVALSAHAAPQSLSTAGTLVVVPASGEVTRANDLAVVTFAIEEIDKDKAAAASRVNQKMKQGTEIVKREDPQAKLKTQGYYTYPVYPEEAPPVPGQPARPPKPRVPSAWRVGQSLQATTTALATLPKMVAAAQSVLALNGVRFGLAPETTRKLDEQRIAATYANLAERIDSIAAAMGRKVGDAVLDTVDFEGSGNYGNNVTAFASNAAPPAPPAPLERGAVVEPSFEPGETTLRMRLVGKVRFK
nr:SIMPL domain-containing protein [uncultured Duganella sp.]